MAAEPEKKTKEKRKKIRRRGTEKVFKTFTVNTDWTNRDKEIRTANTLSSYIANEMRGIEGLELSLFTEVSAKGFFNLLSSRDHYDIAEMWTAYSQNKKTGKWNQTQPVGMGIAWKKGAYEMIGLRRHRADDSRYMSITLESDVKDEDGSKQKVYFLVTGVHLPTKGEWMGNEVVKHVEKHGDEAHASIVLGDFNAASHKEISQTFEGSHLLTIPEDEVTTKAGNNIDNVLFSKADFEEKKLIFDIRKEGSKFSHYPIMGGCSFTL